MSTHRIKRLEQFAKALSEWLDGWQFEPNAFERWDAMPTPWYERAVAGHVEFHLIHTAANCEVLLENLQRLIDPMPPEGEDDFDVLFDISPFTGDSVADIKYMSYQFGPLYYNIVHGFLKYMGDESFCEARQSALLWGEESETEAVEPFAPPPVRVLAERLGRNGKLNDRELTALARRLIDVWKAAHDFLAEVDRRPRYLEEPPWIGLIAFHVLLQRLLTSIVRLEPLWAVYERSKYASNE